MASHHAANMAATPGAEDDWSDISCAERVAGAISDLTTRLRARCGPDAADDLTDRLEWLLLTGEFSRALALCRVIPRAEVSALFLSVIRRLEARWQVDGASFADLAFAFFQIRRLIDLTTSPAPLPIAPAPGAPRLLIGLAEGERHGFGVQILASELALNGWAVDLDLTGDGDTLRQRVQETRYDAVGLSVGHDGALQGLADLITDLRHLSCHGGISVMLGGAALVEPRGQYRFLGADVVALTADEAMVWLSAHLAAHRPRLRN